MIEQIDDNSVSLTNLAKLPPRYTDMLVDAPASKFFSVSKSPMKILVPDRRNFCHRVPVVGWYKCAFEFVLLRHIVYCIHRTIPKRSIRHLQVLRQKKNKKKTTVSSQSPQTKL